MSNKDIFTVSIISGTNSPSTLYRDQFINWFDSIFESVKPKNLSVMSEAIEAPSLSSWKDILKKQPENVFLFFGSINCRDSLMDYISFQKDRMFALNELKKLTFVRIDCNFLVNIGEVEQLQDYISTRVFPSNARYGVIIKKTGEKSCSIYTIISPSMPKYTLSLMLLLVRLSNYIPLSEFQKGTVSNYIVNNWNIIQKAHEDANMERESPDGFRPGYFGLHRMQLINAALCLHNVYKETLTYFTGPSGPSGRGCMMSTHDWLKFFGEFNDIKEFFGTVDSWKDKSYEAAYVSEHLRLAIQLYKFINKGKEVVS